MDPQKIEQGFRQFFYDFSTIFLPIVSSDYIAEKLTKKNFILWTLVELKVLFNANNLFNLRQVGKERWIFFVLKIIYGFISVLTNMLQSVVKRILEIVQEDTDRTVVMTAIDTLYEMLEKIGRPVLDVQGATGAILARMKEAFTNKVRWFFC